MTPALHGSGFVTDNETVYTGNPCGYLITVENKTIYFAGDTGLFSEMKLIGETNNIDVALLPIGDNFTMGIEDAAIAADLLNATVTIPMHYNTFDVIEKNPEDFIKHLNDKGMTTKGVVVDFEETFILQ